MKKTFSIVAIAFASLMGLSQAATIVQTQSFSFVPNGNQVLTFNSFNTNSGTFTLQSVTISITLNKVGGSLQVDNDSATGGTIDLSHQVVGSLSNSLGGGSLTRANFTIIGSSGSLTASSTLPGQTIGATTGDATDAFNNTADVDFLAFNPGNTSASDSGAVRTDSISLYEGTGTFTNTLSASQLTSATGLGGLQQAFTVSNVSGDVTITYTYIPEPSTALLGALGVLGLLRRRR